MEKKHKMKKIFIVLAVATFLIFLVSAIPTITEIYPTSDITTSSPYVNITMNITQDDYLPPKNITWSWDGINYSIYDSSLVLFYNFDNRSVLGENGTYVVDLSQYGNNGTVIGDTNITWSSTGGKHNGAFNFSGNLSTVNISNSQSLNITTNQMSISLWIKTISSFSSAKSVLNKELSYRFWWQTEGTFFRVYNSTTNKQTGYVTGLNDGNWHFLTGVYNSTTMLFYVDGILNNTASAINLGTVNFTNNNLYIGSKSGTDNYFNGSIDDVMIFNKSLSTSEIQQLYYSSLTKYNSQNWTFYTNQTLDYSTSILNASNPSHNTNYYLCSFNSTGSETCSTQRTITQIIPNQVLTANFTNSIGTIKSDFYGLTDKGWFATNNLIDIDGDGIRSDASNYTENRNVFLNSGMTLLRLESGLEDLYSNTSDSSGVNFTGDFTRLNDTINFVSDNNLKLLLLIDTMPEWLANTTYCSSQETTCPPSNYTKWKNIIIDLLNRTTNNKEFSSFIMVEVWNEPDTSTFFLKDMTSGYTTINQTRYIEYNSVYNATYDAVKEFDSSILVGGLAVANYRTAGTNAIAMMNSFLGNFSNKMDFVSFHQYRENVDGNFYSQISLSIPLIQTACTIYSANCSRIIISEFAEGNITIKNTSTFSNLYAESNALFYSTILNLIPSNFSGVIYQWSEEYKYSDTSNYPQYPQKYNLYSESLLDNEYTSAYNTTFNVAHLCPAGGTVYQSSSDDSDIKIVSCKNNTAYNGIIINTDTTSRNLTLNINPISSVIGGVIGSITDYETGANYIITNNQTELGIQDSYGIKYLTYDIKTYKLVEGDRFYQYDSFSNNLEPNRNNSWFPESTATHKHIASNLTKTVNATVVVTIPGYTCDEANVVTYKTNSGNKSEWVGSAARSVCSALTSSGYTLTIEPASSSNELEFDFSCTEYESLTYPIIKIFVALALLCSLIAYIWYKGGLKELTIAEIIIMVILIFVSLPFITEIANILADRCAP